MYSEDHRRLIEALGLLEEAFSCLCKIKGRTPDVSSALRRTLKTIEALDEVML
jgi:hypothetical protein